VFPTNKALTSDLTIMFTPRTPLPTNSKIEIDLPSTFPPLSSNVVCKLSGGITSYKSCAVSGLKISIVTSADYSTGAIIGLFKNI